MANDLHIDAIGQIHISVADIGRAVAFYRDTLGMRLLFEVPGQPMAFFDCGGIWLYLRSDSNPHPTNRPSRRQGTQGPPRAAARTNTDTSDTVSVRLYFWDLAACRQRAILQTQILLLA